MRLIDVIPEDLHYDVVIIGSGFGSSFFLHKYLAKSRRDARVLILERGHYSDHAWQIEHRRNSPIDPWDVVTIPEGHKIWNFTIGFGGGTNCWWGQTPRMLPNDFRLHSLYGVGRDWPLSYDDLEPYYSEAEAIMAVSGDSGTRHLFPRSRDYPQPPHRFAAPDLIMKRRYPEHHINVPTARARVATANRPPCCATGTCNLCPIDAKFTALNEMAETYASPAVSILLDAEVERFDIKAGQIEAAVFSHRGRERRVTGDLFVLGANAIFSPAILLRSGDDGPLVGRRLHEQVGYQVEVWLNGVANFDGSTTTTGANYRLYDGDHRRDAGAALIYFENYWSAGFRLEYGKWRETLPLIITVEDLPQESNLVALPTDGGAQPVAHHPTSSSYAERGVRRALDQLPELLSPLPIEAIRHLGYRPTESHVQGTLVMGHDPETSVVDANQIHHKYRNLMVVGTSVFPTGAPANPSLTAAALSLRAVDRLS